MTDTVCYHENMNPTADTFWNDAYDNHRDFSQLKTVDLLSILELASNPTGNHLDIGCGTGNLTRDLYHLGYQPTGIDLSERAIKIARVATTKDIEYQCGDFMQLEFTETFSLITCKLVYAFIKDKTAFLEKVINLLTTDGSFILITPTYENDADATPISVKYTGATNALRSTFADVQEKDLGWARCFVCRKSQT